MSFSDSVDVAIEFIGPFFELIFFLKDINFEVTPCDLLFDVFVVDKDDCFSNQVYFFASFSFEVDLKCPAMKPNSLI